MNTIDYYRQKIDDIDAQLIKLFNARASHAQQIGALKQTQQRTNLYDPARESKLMTRLRSLNEGPLLDQHISNIYRELVSSCLSLEQIQTVAYLGPEGTFTQMAARNHFGSSAAFIACMSVADCFDAIERKQANFCVVPIENSTEGVISLTIELLGTKKQRIIGEQELLVEHCLLANKLVEYDQITTIYGHPQALGQCQHWISEHIPNATIEPVASNSQGASLATTVDNSACIAAKINADIYSLQVLAERVEDIVGNKTRFVVIGDLDVAPTTSDKTALIFATPHTPGALFHALQHFNDAGVDLTRLESKPLKTASWDYSFFVEFNGHIQDDAIAQLIKNLKKDTTFIKFLGSFPRPREV